MSEETTGQCESKITRRTAIVGAAAMSAVPATASGSENKPAGVWDWARNFDFGEEGCDEEVDLDGRLETFLAVHFETPGDAGWAKVEVFGPDGNSIATLHVMPNGFQNTHKNPRCTVLKLWGSQGSRTGKYRVVAKGSPNGHAFFNYNYRPNA